MEALAFVPLFRGGELVAWTGKPVLERWQQNDAHKEIHHEVESPLFLSNSFRSVP